MSTKKIEIIVGMGEIGTPIYKLLKKTGTTISYDVDQKKMNVKEYERTINNPVSILHFCIPFTKFFFQNVIDYTKKRKPELVVIHSTIEPHTTEYIQKKLQIPALYSATRGIHRRMLNDLKRYTKFYSVYDWAPKSQWASKQFSNRFKKAGVKTKKMKDPLTLELAKIVVDTSYYGWLITFAQLSNMIAIKNKVNYDEMWSFGDEIHKFLGNRPKMFPGFIGGHCVIPNLSLIDEESLWQIDKINNLYTKKSKKCKINF